MNFMDPFKTWKLCKHINAFIYTLNIDLLVSQKPTWKNLNLKDMKLLK